MADRPILFSAPMVRALLDGRKTQTRRTIRIQPPEWATYCEQPEMFNALGKWVPSGLWRWSEPEQSLVHSLRQWPVDEDGRHYWLRPPFSVGDRLWGKETWRVHRAFDQHKPSRIGKEARVWYEADRDNCDQHGKVRVCIFMPRWASRLTLTVTDVRLQRLQQCSEADALAEGVVEYEPTMEDPAEFSAFHGSDVFNNAVSAYHDLWNIINGPGAWEANPWVVAVTFDVREGNIDG